MVIGEACFSSRAPQTIVGVQTMFLVPLPRAPRSYSQFARLAACGNDSLDATQRSPALDVAETEGGYNVSVDLPGVSKQDVKIAIDGRRISVSANAQREETKVAGERLIYRERAAASFARSFTLPEEIDQDASQARLDNGVLSLTLTKKRAAAARHLTVN
jgi:HSP20 family protein